MVRPCRTRIRISFKDEKLTYISGNKLTVWGSAKKQQVGYMWPECRELATPDWAKNISGHKGNKMKNETQLEEMNAASSLIRNKWLC
jgi:hypothetical protein